MPPRRKPLPTRTSSLHYQTFTSASPPPDDDDNGAREGGTPLPKKQLGILAFISLAEQTALNSFSPYLPNMTREFPDVDPNKVGVYVGIIASSFAIAQVLTNFYWGRLSDRVGRKPVILWGIFWTIVGFSLFGYCTTLWQAVLVQSFIGAVNGNQGVVSTILGEITDRSNQSSSFAFIPMVYGIGSILGPVVGGLLAGAASGSNHPILVAYPYLLPNLFSAGLLSIELILSMFLLEESLEKAQDLPPLGRRIVSLFAWLWQFTAPSTRPTYLRRSTSTANQPNDTMPTLIAPAPDQDPDYEETELLKSRTLKSRPVVLLLSSFFIFNIANIGHAALYPLFISTPAPDGRGLTPKAIGLTLSFAGIGAILFQMTGFSAMHRRLGNKAAYVLAITLIAMTFFAVPNVSYPSPSDPNKSRWLYAQLSGILLVKSVAANLGLTCAMMMITNASPDNSVLGQINGVAQTLSAAGRAVGPFISGGLWSLVLEKVGGLRAAWIVWGVFGGVALVGATLATGISGKFVNIPGEQGDEEQGDEEHGDEEREALLEGRT